MKATINLSQGQCHGCGEQHYVLDGVMVDHTGPGDAALGKWCEGSGLAPVDDDGLCMCGRCDDEPKRVTREEALGIIQRILRCAS